MIRMGKESKLDPEEVLDRAVEYFGREWGLDVVERGDCCARFAGAGGHVYVQAADAKDETGSDVEIEGREWERQIRQFMGKI
ncbi:MAG: hypothetical protein PVG11_02785 [Anaerolineae bacterium]|jgi:hypothetical protein